MRKRLISDEKVNCSRQSEIDLLKAYPILFMVIIHVYENLSIGRIDAAPHTWAEHILQFLAGPATAPAFMFAMGVGIIYSRKSTPEGLLKRGMTLFAGGYILNAARSGILTTVGTALTGRFDPELTKYLFLNGDIFHFSGLAFMLSALFLKMKLRPIAIAGISLLMQLGGRYLADLPEMTGDLGYITGHFYKCTWVCCFPLLQWYVYPALGICFGTVLQHVSDLRAWYRLIGAFAAVLLLCYAGTLAIAGISIAPFYSLEGDAFYNQSFLSTVFSVLLICLILSVSHPVSLLIKDKPIGRFVKQMSSRLTDIFIIQWILIGIVFSVFRTFDLPDIPFIWVVPVGVLFTLAAGGLLQSYLKRRTMKDERHFNDYSLR